MLLFLLKLQESCLLSLLYAIWFIQTISIIWTQIIEDLCTVIGERELYQTPLCIVTKTWKNIEDYVYGCTGWTSNQCQVHSCLTTTNKRITATQSSNTLWIHYYTWFIFQYLQHMCATKIRVLNQSSYLVNFFFIRARLLGENVSSGYIQHQLTNQLLCMVSTYQSYAHLEIHVIQAPSISVCAVLGIWLIDRAYNGNKCQYTCVDLWLFS